MKTKSKSKGWIPDLPDFRDYEPTDDKIKPLLKKAGIAGEKKAKLPTKTDLREWCPPVENQGDIGSCTAHAAVGLVEYFMRKCCGEHIDGSRLFVYKTSRNMLGWTGDDGAYLRTAIGSLVLFGFPPEEYWPYDESQFNAEPTPFCYAFAHNYKALKYYRLDGPGVTKAALLARIKTQLVAEIPSIFGFTTFTSMDSDENEDGHIPFPDRREKSDGGHAVMAVGYNDNIEIVNPLNKRIKTKGALLIRNSWGTEWGMKGYGWLPYDYILKDLAIDWWCVLEASWVDTGQFKY
jgi:C1A family cysteine protease